MEWYAAVQLGQELKALGSLKVCHTNQLILDLFIVW